MNTDKVLTYELLATRHEAAMADWKSAAYAAIQAKNNKSLHHQAYADKGSPSDKFPAYCAEDTRLERVQAEAELRAQLAHAEVRWCEASLAYVGQATSPIVGLATARAMYDAASRDNQ